MNNLTVTVIVSLLSTIIGGGISFTTQYFTISSQLKQDDKRQRELLEKEIKKEKKELLIIFSEILRIDGEVNIITEPSNKKDWEINIDCFFKKYRPLLYSKFHLLNKDFKKIMRSIDNTVANANHNEELTTYDNKMLIQGYKELIQIIEKLLYEDDSNVI
ncbi:hypothetical protein BFR40_00345 [Brochothrix thermosphacta]|uniref:hypothetical protein n=1 Tax=Brochothrix thermosphacta TaxID=2756 RepID=UPI00083F599A|nr:hypothetical protein [Brochothrix thermosphacta]ODJ53100.1 hypothetical protein BFR40_00345 [Brochothrix thermosphacta]